MIGGRPFHAASRSEIDRLVRPLVASRVFGGPGDLMAVHEAEAWRIQVSNRGDVAVLAPWRDHLSILSIAAMWCPIAAIPRAVSRMRELGLEHGFTDLVSPPVPLEEILPYQAAGMRTSTVVTALVLVRMTPRPTLGSPPDGLTLRPADRADVPALLDVDSRSFDAFWRYDRTHLEGFCETSRLTIAERGCEAVGYTLCTVDRGEGMLGRLCVVPEAQRQGVGSALLLDAIDYVASNHGERLTLSTQTDNGPSQALYRKAGFRDTGQRYAFLRFGTDEG